MDRTRRGAALAWGLLALAGAAAGEPPRRTLVVELAGQEQNAVRTSWPGIGCWFWGEEEFKPEGYRRFLERAEKHTGFGLLTTSIRHPVEVTDAAVHDQIKAATVDARRRGIGVVMDLDVRLARGAFQKKHPDELQELVRLREAVLAESGETVLAAEPVALGDHYTFKARPYEAVAGRVLRVYAYRAGEKGIDPATVEDVTGRCRVVQADARGVKVALAARPEELGKRACLLAAFTHFTPDVFAPHLPEFERAILRQYADVPLAGACKDEWGFPGRFEPRIDDVYFSRAQAAAYAKRRGGRDLVRDLLLMVKGEVGRDGERAAAINHLMEMNRERNVQVEEAFYRHVKEVFGPQAMVGTHPTWYPYPSPEEVFKNGLDWWAVRRDLAQTDEATPFAARTALAKRWRSPIWMNMYYNPSPKAYEEDLWRHALGGGRMNIHPLWPGQGDTTAPLLEGRLMAAEARVRLLNFIATAPEDCPVAVVFGHPAALSWVGPGLGEVGMGIVDGLWERGYYADLIPTSEIASGALTVTAEGQVSYGPQRYQAVVLVQPQYERAEVAEFFRKAAAGGKTALYRVGEWTRDFEGRPFDGAGALPAAMKAVDWARDGAGVLERLRAAVEPQTPGTLRGGAGFRASMMPRPTGTCRLLDGTVIWASGQEDVMGDPIRRTVTVQGHEVTFDAVGVAAVRLDGQGKLQALAAGGLKAFRGAGVQVQLPERLDVALWRDARGQWRGVVQGGDGPVPQALAALTKDWTRLAVPVPLGK